MDDPEMPIRGETDDGLAQVIRSMVLAPGSICDIAPAGRRMFGVTLEHVAESVIQASIPYGPAGRRIALSKGGWTLEVAPSGTRYYRKRFRTVDDPSQLIVSSIKDAYGLVYGSRAQNMRWGWHTSDPAHAQAYAPQLFGNSQLDANAYARFVPIVDLADNTDAEVAKCPMCEAYLHMYATTCFGCGTARGSAYWTNVDKLATVFSVPSAADLGQNRVIADLLQQVKLRSPDASDLAVRMLVYLTIRGVLGDEPAWDLPTSRISYLGGLDAHPHRENATLKYVGGKISIVADRSKQEIAAVDPCRVLGVSAHGTLDEVLGGIMFGFVAGGAVLMRQIPPSQGGAVKLAYVDESGIWRAALIGNRTGITDTRYAFDAFRAWAFFIGRLCQWAAVRRELDALPERYADELGLRPPARPDADAKLAAQGAPASFQGAQRFLHLIAAIEDVVYDDWERAKADTIATGTATWDQVVKAAGIWQDWGRRALPVLRGHRQALATLNLPAHMLGLRDQAIEALDLYIRTADLYANTDGMLAESDLAGEAADRAIGAWTAFQRELG